MGSLGCAAWRSRGIGRAMSTGLAADGRRTRARTGVGPSAPGLEKVVQERLPGCTRPRDRERDGADGLLGAPDHVELAVGADPSDVDRAPGMQG